jgi:hypothetical protein
VKKRIIGLMVFGILGECVWGFLAPDEEKLSHPLKGGKLYEKQKALSVPVVSPKSSAISEWEKIRTRYKREDIALEPYIRWNENTGYPLYIYWIKTPKRKSEPKDVLLSFLKEHNALFPIDQSSLRYDGTRRISEKEARPIFTQVYKGIEVESILSGHLYEAEDGEYEIESIWFEYYPDIDIDTTPKITPEDAFKIAERDLSAKDIEATSTKFCILPPGAWGEKAIDDFYLVYILRILCKDPFGNWVYIVDAHTGDILLFYNNIRFFESEEVLPIKVPTKVELNLKDTETLIKEKATLTLNYSPPPIVYDTTTDTSEIKKRLLGKWELVWIGGDWTRGTPSFKEIVQFTGNNLYICQIESEKGSLTIEGTFTIVYFRGIPILLTDKPYAGIHPSISFSDQDTLVIKSGPVSTRIYKRLPSISTTTSILSQSAKRIPTRVFLNIPKGQLKKERATIMLNIGRKSAQRAPAKRFKVLQHNQVIMEEGFEDENFPAPASGWAVYDGNSLRDGEYYFNSTDVRSFGGQRSAWCAGGGRDGEDLDPSRDDYPNNCFSWLVYGPFSLENAADAKLCFHYWLESETDNDFFYFVASTDRNRFVGYRRTGNTNGWVYEEFDLSNLLMPGNSSIWIAFVFVSDHSFTLDGAFVDDVKLIASPP